MKEDKEWLIKRVENYIPLNDKTVGHVVDNILDIIRQLDESHKPVVVPKFVADHIEFCKSKDKRLNAALSESPDGRMVTEMGVSWVEASEIYARAWLDGFTVSNWESGRNGASPSQLKRIADFFGAAVNELLKEEEEK